MNQKILLVDDDVELCELLTTYLQREGIATTAIHNGQQAIDHLSQNNEYDAIVLDFMMPGMQGLDVLQRLRSFSSVPVLMLTARGDDIDRIVGLESGADDYIPKPCNPRELLARLRAILRRTDSGGRSAQITAFNTHGVELDASTRVASCDGKAIDMTSAEFNTLHALMARQGEVVSKETLTELALNRKFTRYDRSVDVHISNVRKKLAAVIGEREIIKTVRGAGYIMVKETDV